MKEAEVPEVKWAGHLKHLLMGKMLDAKARNVPEDSQNDYWAVKEALLNTSGLSTVECVANFFSMNYKQSGSWTKFGRKAEFQAERLFHGCLMLKEATAWLVLARMFTACNQGQLHQNA